MSDAPAPRQATIRNAVIHLHNEQPLLADLFETPGATDVGLLCTNLRTLSGTRPVFADHAESTFFFPYGHIRFVEIHPDRGARALAAEAAAAAAGTPAPPEDDELEIDEDFLRRIRDV